MQIVSAILGMLFVILLIVKIYLHNQLNSRNGFITRFEIFSMLEYYLPFNKFVSKESEGLKRCCNIIYGIALVSLALSIFSFVLFKGNL